MTHESHKFVTTNFQRSLRHVASILYDDRTNLRSLAQNQILTMAVKDNKDLSFEREASIAEIHAQSASL